jgi:ubiquinone/menaquinone biosynthesis C-methylase UbiE
MSTHAEVHRLRATYARRAARLTWDGANAGNRAIVEERDAAVRRMLARHGLVPLPAGPILEVGCGHGQTLAGLRALGARAAQLVGVDLLPDRLAEARRRHPDLAWPCANAEHLPFRDGTFALVLVFTVFSSILDRRMAARVGGEILRVLRPDGAVLWYDFRYPSPQNAEVRPVSRAGIRRRLPGLRADLESITLLPPLARRLGRAAPLLYALLAGLPPLRTHWIGLLHRPPAA